jgi:hypothetical protein
MAKRTHAVVEADAGVVVEGSDRRVRSVVAAVDETTDDEKRDMIRLMDIMMDQAMALPPEERFEAFARSLAGLGNGSGMKMLDWVRGVLQSNNAFANRARLFDFLDGLRATERAREGTRVISAAQPTDATATEQTEPRVPDVTTPPPTGDAPATPNGDAEQPLEEKHDAPAAPVSVP